MAKGTKLADRHKRWIVQRLACFESLEEVQKALSAEFGISLTLQSIQHYDPGKFAGKDLAVHLVELFNSLRKEFLEKSERIPIANPAVRLARMERICQAAMARGNYVLAASMLEQAAKERGGSFTNRRELTGKDGGAIKHQDTSGMTDDQIDQELMRLLGQKPAVVPATPPKTTH